jgi:Gpi18-like mannosyltransferase
VSVEAERSDRSTQWRSWTRRLSLWQEITASTVVTRVALTLVGLTAMALLPLSSRRLDFIPDAPWLSIWAQWDAEHYISIAVSGYQFDPGRFTNIPFFPLYPWLVKLVGLPFGPLDEHGAALIGLVLSNVALLVGLLYLAKLVAHDLTLSVARRTILYTLVFPATLFLSSVYAESLFLATAAASLYHARRGEWYRAGVAGALAALTRPFGVLLIVPIAIELWRQRAPLRALPAALLPPAGLAFYIGYLAVQFGNPMAYFDANRIWGRGFHWPWETLLGYIRGPLVMFDWPYSWLDLLSVVVIVLILLIGRKRVPLSYSAYVAAGLVFALSTGVAWFSANRHALALFPVLVILASFGERRAFNWAWLALSIALAVGFMARVAVGYWVA